MSVVFVCVCFDDDWLGWLVWVGISLHTRFAHTYAHLFIYILYTDTHLAFARTAKRNGETTNWNVLLAGWLSRELTVAYTSRCAHVCYVWLVVERSCVSSVCMSSVNQLHCGESQWRPLPAVGGGCSQRIRESSGVGYSYRVSMGIMGWKQNWPIDAIYKNSVCWIEASVCVGKWRRTCAKWWPHTAHTYITFHWCRPSHTKFAIIPHVHSFHILIQSKAAAIFATPSIKHSLQTQNNHIFLSYFSLFIFFMFIINKYDKSSSFIMISCVLHTSFSIIIIFPSHIYRSDHHPYINYMIIIWQQQLLCVSILFSNFVAH